MFPFGHNIQLIYLISSKKQFSDVLMIIYGILIMGTSKNRFFPNFNN